MSLMSFDATAIGTAVGSALLGSSCCAIQLVLNYFSIGCAGFAVLDPYRPAFLSLSLGSFGSMLYFDRQRGKPVFSKRNLFSFILMVSLSVLPQVVNYVNNPSLEGLEEDEEVVDVFSVDISGMNCLACANAVHNGINGIDGVKENQVAFESKSGEVVVDASKGLTDEDLEEALSYLGFGAKITKKKQVRRRSSSSSSSSSPSSSAPSTPRSTKGSEVAGD
eukprot:TRINITY_DN7651_c0_g1_i1.p1 TRINITY_DN7651_c0_g1~~TRINITY_DN7651_c0_g1_i1.p1  ORF type:complete len:235 (-),score=70.22 TRINITY_DN7651_c0_g1_i1:192-854(-)